MEFHLFSIHQIKREGIPLIFLISILFACNGNSSEILPLDKGSTEAVLLLTTAMSGEYDPCG